VTPRRFATDSLKTTAASAEPFAMAARTLAMSTPADVFADREMRGDHAR
jgi:hypothetical protein